MRKMNKALISLSVVVLGGLSLPVMGTISTPPQRTQEITAPVPPVPTITQEEMVDAAKAAQAWLKLVDSGNYEQSWEDGSVSFKQVMPKKSWVFALDAARKPLGPIQSRTLVDEIPKANPSRLPAGLYMVFNFKSSFVNATNSGELLTMRKDPDGHWRVLTYQVN